jgi:hypothetical protein
MTSSEAQRRAVLLQFVAIAQLPRRDRCKYNPTYGYCSEAGRSMQTPKENELVQRLDALYTERDNALSEGDLDRVYELQAAIAETTEQVSGAQARSGPK